MRKLIFSFGLVLMGFCFAKAQTAYATAKAQCDDRPLPEVQQCMRGATIPAFTGFTLEGDTLTPADLEGKIVVLHFWFMACVPCIAELDGLNAVADRYRNQEDVLFLAITFDTPTELRKEFFPHHSLDFQLMAGATNLVFEVFQISWGFPTTLVVDREGQIQNLFSGGSSDAETASREVEQKLIDSIELCKASAD